MFKEIIIILSIILSQIVFGDPDEMPRDAAIFRFFSLFVEVLQYEYLIQSTIN